MISLADDRYIDEIFQDKITGKRRNIFVTFTAVAAALALVVGGISYFVSTAGNADKITSKAPLVSEAEAVDYSLYFQNTDPDLTEVNNDEWSVQSAGIFCYFSNSQSEYLKSIMPFDMSGFINANCHFYYDHNDELKTISLYANDEADDSQEKVKMLYIDAHREGEFFCHLPLEKCKSMKRFDVDVYGFDFLETDNTAGVLFAKDGREYLIGGDNMSFDEIGVIMDSIIENGLWADRFDFSRAEIEFYDIRTGITLAEANEISPFAGHVPNMENVGGMSIGSSKGAFYYAVRNENNGIEPVSLTITYSGSDMDGGWNNEVQNDIAVIFYTDKADVKPFENIVKLEDTKGISLKEFAINGRYAFTIDCGEFMVNIEAENCSEEALSSYITAMRIGANEAAGTLFEEITLAEANKIPPYEGYVPQNETAGDMKLGLVQYNGSNIVLDYSFSGENRFSYIGLTYTADKRMTADYSVITLEEFINGDIVIHNDDSEDGRNNYKFAVECNGLYGSFYVCVDGEKCTTAELYDCILTLLMEKKFDAGSLEYSNNLEPFAGYVPTKQDILIYDKDERYDSGRIRPRYIHETVNGEGAVVHMHLRFYKDTKNLTLDYYVYGSDTAATVQDVEGAIPLGSVTPEIIKMFLSDGNKAEFIIGCGEFFIQVSAENCSVEEIWAYISEIRGVDADDAETQNLIIMKEVRELAEKGDDLDWVDFAKYYGVEAGSGLYIMAYEIKGMDYSVTIGGVPNEKPWYIYLNGENDSRIDIRYDSVDEFLKENKDMLSLDTIKELAKKGDDLMWDDFDGYSFTEGGSGLYIRFYSVEDGYSLSIGGGGPNDKPMYIYLSGNGKERIDIRYDSVEEFLESKPFINFEF